MKKRVLSILLAALMIVSLLPTVALATETAGLDNFEKVQTYTDGKFTDVKADDWFTKNVSSAYELNLMVGKSKDFFDTDSNLTVAEAMTIAARLRSIYYTGKAEFEQGNPWYQAYTDYCKANGIADPADYDMNKAITRGEFAEIFANAFPADALKKINTVQDNMIPDVKKTDKFSTAIYLLYRAGVLVGNDAKGTFAPDSNIKRVEVAAITTRMAQPALRESIRLVKPSSGGGSYTPPALTTYTVTFDLNGVGSAIDSQTVIKDSKVSKPATDPVDSAGVHTFAGWYKDGEYKTDWNFDTDVVTADTIIYAKWTTTIEKLVTNVPCSDNKDTAPNGAWGAGNNKCYKAVDENKTNLYFWTPQINTEAHITKISVTTNVTKVEDNYLYGDGIITFAMTDGSLSSIKYTSTNNSFTKYNGTYAPVVPVTGVSIERNRATLLVGDSWLALGGDVIFIPADATNKSVTWSSSNTDVAAVDASGNVTAIAFGTATITVTTVDGGKTATCTVTVSETKTLAEIMTTYAATFPNSNENGWAESSCTHKMYYKDGALCIDSDTNKVLNNSDVAEREVGGYQYTDGTTTVIFSIDNGGALTSIQYSSPNDGQSQYNGVYTAPAPVESVLWTGEAIANNFGDQPYLLSDGGTELQEANASAGDVIKFYVEPIVNETPWYVKIEEGHWSLTSPYIALCSVGADTNGGYVEYDLVANDGSISMPLTQEILNTACTQLYYGGSFLLNGDNIKCTKITLVK